MYTVRVRLHSSEGNERAGSIFVDLKRVDRRRIEELTYLYIFVSIVKYKVMKTFRRVLYDICFLLGNSPASEFYMPIFRDTLLHLHRRIAHEDETVFRNVGI
jgi:hypothetical protein